MNCQIIGVEGLPVIKVVDNLCEAAEKQGTPIQNGDILMVTHVIVSRAEGKVVNLDKVHPSNLAENIATQCNKDPSRLYSEKQRASYGWTTEEAFSQVDNTMIEAFSVCSSPKTCIEKIDKLLKVGVNQIVAGSPIGLNIQKSINLMEAELFPSVKNHWK